MAATEENIDYMLNLVFRADLAPQMRHVIPWIFWEIWKGRNAAIFTGKAPHYNIVLAGALSDMEEWMCQQSLQDLEAWRCIDSSPLRTRRWSRPAKNMLKYNIHASWRSLSSFCGGAWLLCDSNGDVLFHA
ncbi:hypothetical protein CARUB_v10003025mg, partial [Capsella rubella]